MKLDNDFLDLLIALSDAEARFATAKPPSCPEAHSRLKKDQSKPSGNQR